MSLDKRWSKTINGHAIIAGCKKIANFYSIRTGAVSSNDIIVKVKDCFAVCIRYYAMFCSVNGNYKTNTITSNF